MTAPDPTAGEREPVDEKPDEREAFCWDLGPHLTDALESMGVEDADLSDGRVLADTVYCLGYRKPSPPAVAASTGTSEDEPNVIQRIVDAWDCCGTCAGGVLASHEARVRRETAAQALREAADFCEPVIAGAMGSPRTDFADGWRAASRQFLEEIRDRADQIEAP